MSQKNVNTMLDLNKIKIGERLRKEVGDLKSLSNSIREVGLLHPIVIDEEGNLIAGLRRLKACESLGWKEVPINIVPLKDLTKGELDENRERKDFTVSEMVAIERAIGPEIRAEALDREKAGVPSGNLPQGTKSRDLIAKYIGVSGRTLDKVEAIVEAYEQNPDRFGTLMENVDSKKTSISYAYDVVSRAERHENTPLLPEGQYDVIYADPPWKYYYKARGNPEYHYALMEDEEIYKLKVPSADDAILFLWATNPKLPEALKVVENWGFTYKTNLVWIKDKIGTGFYVRGQHELLLIATKGKIPTPVNDTRPSSVLEATRRGHSEKPDEVYGIIESMYPNRQYLELFARNTRPNWTSWGNEI